MPRALILANAATRDSWALALLGAGFQVLDTPATAARGDWPERPDVVVLDGMFQLHRSAGAPLREIPLVFVAGVVGTGAQLRAGVAARRLRPAALVEGADRYRPEKIAAGAQAALSRGAPGPPSRLERVGMAMAVAGAAGTAVLPFTWLFLSRSFALAVGFLIAIALAAAALDLGGRFAFGQPARLRAWTWALLVFAASAVLAAWLKPG